MALARTRSVALLGVEGYGIDVEAHIGTGKPGLTLVGLPDAALREARDRIRAAIVNSGEHWPETHITVSLSPASLPKRGSGFDLSIAVAILAASGVVPAAKVQKTVFLAELSLDGRTRPIHGILPMVLAETVHGCRTFVVARANAAEARLVGEADVHALGSLAEVVQWLRGEPVEATEPADTEEQASALPESAGGHNLFLLGPPGSGKSMLAERIPTIMPRLEREEALEVTAIHSVAGSLPPDKPLITRPPFCAPHHTATRAAIIGGGSSMLRPGAVSLAHRGLLFLDEAPEFARGVLDCLRQPLENGEVTVARAAATARFPARFLLVMAANPCPCGTSGPRCVCPSAARRRYLGRLSGPLLDRVDLKVELHPVSRAELLADQAFVESSAMVAERVAQARERAASRLQGTPWSCNAVVPGTELRRRFPPQPEALRVLGEAMDRGTLSARGADRVLKLAWTIADLADKDRPTAEEVGYALALWTGSAQ